MKTKSVVFFLIVIIVIVEFGCSKDDAPTNAPIVGKWQVDSIYNRSQDSMIISTDKNSYGSKAWIAFNDTATKFIDNGFPMGNINGWSIMNQFWANYHLLGTSRMKLKVVINTMVAWAPFDYTFWNAIYNDSATIKFNATSKNLTLVWEDSSNVMFLTRKE